MTAAVILAGSVLASAAVLLGGLRWALRSLWDIRGSWDATNAQLAALVGRVADLVAAKDADHARLERRADEIGARLERHLDWHDKH